MRYLTTIAGLIGILSSSAGAQDASSSPKTSGLLVGAETERNRVVSSVGTRESGVGGALVLGYAFTDRWMLYGRLGQASINAANGGSYSFTQAELGARAQFRVPRFRVTPFAQVGVAGQALSQYTLGSNYTASGAGLSFGAGLYWHFSTPVAASAALTRTVGAFGGFAENGVPTHAGTVNATSTRLHCGLVWFP